VEVMTGAAKLPLTLGLHGNNFTYMWCRLVWWNTIRVSDERYFTLKTDESRILENVGTYLPNYMAAHLREL
jgi:hypothetical protein